MKLSAVSLLFFIYSSTALDCGLTQPCPKGTCLPGSKEDTVVTFDLSPLRGFDGSASLNSGEGQLQRLGFQGNDWYVSVCGETTYQCRGQRGNAIQVSVADSSRCYILSRSQSQAFVLIDNDDVNQGITATFGDGDAHDGCPSKRTMTLNIRCAKSNTIIADAEPSKSDKCHTVITIESPSGCPIVSASSASVVTSATTPSTPSQTEATPAGETHEFGAVSRFAFIVMIGLCVYCTVFSVYNYHVHGERGLQVLPHPNFWCDTLPTFIRETTSRCFDWMQDCWSLASDRLRGFSHRSAPGSQSAEYEKIHDGSGTGSSNANFYDVENDADLDEDEPKLATAAPVTAGTKTAKPKPSKGGEV